MFLTSFLRQNRWKVFPPLCFSLSVAVMRENIDNYPNS